MRICLVITDLAPGGAQRVLTALATEWGCRGNEVHLLSLHGGPGQGVGRVGRSVKVEYLGLPSGNSIGAAKVVQNLRRIRTLRGAIRSLRPDVVVSFIDQCNVLCLLACLGLGVPVIVSERMDPRHSEIGRIWRLLRRVTYPLAQSLVVQTKEVASLYASSLIRSVVTIPNPVYPPGQAERLDLSAPYVAAVGRLSHEKGVDLLIEAFAEVAPEFPDWTLVIAGDGPERPSLEAQSRRLGIGARCLFLGTVTDATAVTQDADLFVLPSRTEGFPNALCEAMACGIACIATDCPSGPRNIVRDDVDGVLVPPEQSGALARAMCHLMADPEKRRRLGERASAIVDRFSTKHVLALWDAVLKKATATAERCGGAT